MVTYNSALLVDGGFIEGEVIPDGNGNYHTVVMLHLTNQGHDLLERLETDANNKKPNKPIATSEQKISIFISHSSKDEKLAEALVALLRSALNVPADKIRCTSVNGYRLPIGADTEEQLRQEVHDAEAFIGLITPSSIASAYVMFELGARWGAQLHLAPLLGAGAGKDYLRGPLGSLNALECEDPAQLHQLIGDLAKRLKIQEVTSAAAYQNLIDGLIAISKTERAVVPTLSAAPPKPALPPLSPVDVIENEILKVISKSHTVEARDIAEQIKHFNLHRLKLDQLLDRLAERKLIRKRLDEDSQARYTLTPAGRDYLIENYLLN